MPRRYAAFLSYAHRYRDWVKVLQENLERGLAQHGRKGRVFLDDADLGTGRSWVGQLEAGLAQSDCFVLVVTPEALASPWAKVERDGYLSDRPDWQQGGLQLAYLVSTPLGPFLKAHQYADFREHDEGSYRQAYRELLAGVLGRPDRRDPPEAPPDLEVPQPPEQGLPPVLRGKLIDALAPELDRLRGRVFVQTTLGLKFNLEDYPAAEAAASAALVQATGDDQPAAGALRVVDVLAASLRADEEPDAAARFEALREPLRALTASATEPDLLATYRDWVVDANTKMVDYFQQEEELEVLDRIFVELEIQPTQRLTRPEAGRAAKSDEGAPAPQLDRSLGIRDLLQLDPAAHPGVTGRWVILGDPGSGKTTLVRHLAASLARDPTAPWLPVFVSLPRAAREGGDLLERMQRRLSKAGRAAKGLSGVLASQGQSGRLIFLLDGLDEVPREDRDDADSSLRLLSERFPGPIIVTSRPIGYHRPDGDFREVRLLPFDRQRRREFLARWLGRREGRLDEERADQGLELLSTHDGLWELSGNPLYLTLMALILEEGDEPARNRTRLYDQVFDLLLDGRHKPEPRKIDAKADVREALRYLGYGMTEENRDTAAQEELERRLYREEANRFRLPLERVPRWRASMRIFLDDLAQRTGILGPHDGEDADWRFWHRTFREALAAEGLEGRIRREGAEAVLAAASEIAGQESAWAEPYALLTARVQDPDTLVRKLMEANSTLGLRALATAERISDETLYELLELSGDWEERSEVYRRLPELVGDGDRALRLLDRLRQHTRNGNDLFFVDLAVEAVGKRWPDLDAAAVALRERLYDHIPPPEPELFEAVETPLDGTVPLWCEVPTGRHWVGSPEDVGYADERPRHEHVLEEPLRIAAVPLTNIQFDAFDPDHRSHGQAAESQLQPVVDVTWFQAISFCRWLASRVPGCTGARLPTEEEWEAACRAGSETAYWKGDEESDLATVGWYDGNSQRRIHAVGEKPANAWGLHDAHGNVFEWTASPWRKSYAEVQPEEADPTSGWRVVRGGSFGNSADLARSAFRFWGEPGGRDVFLGFRVVLPAPCRDSAVDLGS